VVIVLVVVAMMMVVTVMMVGAVVVEMGTTCIGCLQRSFGACCSLCTVGGTVLGLEHNFVAPFVIGSHNCWLEANVRVI
jgi:hypothetical protein